MLDGMANDVTRVGNHEKVQLFVSGSSSLSISVISDHAQPIDSISAWGEDAEI
jgi:hypothetical protein